MQQIALLICFFSLILMNVFPDFQGGRLPQSLLQAADSRGFSGKMSTTFPYSVDLDSWVGIAGRLTLRFTRPFYDEAEEALVMCRGRHDLVKHSLFSQPGKTSKVVQLCDSTSCTATDKGL